MAKAPSPVDNVLKYVKANKIEFIDMKFMDFPGQWQHFTVPSSQLDAKSFDDGFGLMVHPSADGNLLMKAICL
jgi:glutamine synthetase